MTRTFRLLLLALPVALLVVPVSAQEPPVLDLDGSGAPTAEATLSPSVQPDCPLSWAIARLKCKKDASGAAVGLYGGAEVFLFCDGDRADQTLCVSGFSYGIRMSSENGVAVDCVFQGNGVVNESCGDVQLTIN
jgi:hypothetical protein